MDQRDSIPSPRSTSRYRQTRTKNIIKQHRDPHPTSSLPSLNITTAASSTQPLDNLSDEYASASEPFLRFPRPQGNKRLANWISSSDPNIMDLASETDSELGLAGSTYELIQKEEGNSNTPPAGTDSESQDDSQHDFDGSVSESVDSLDQFRQDDVQSLASTDHIEDEEDDGLQPHYDDDSDDASTAPEDEGSRLTDVTLVNHDRESAAGNESQDEEEHSDAESRSSIEYTRQSLGTPSILTPEASKILSPGQDDDASTSEQTEASNTGKRAVKGTRTTSRAIKSKLSDFVTSFLPPRPAPSDTKAHHVYRQEHWFACDLWRALDIIHENPRQIFVSFLTVVLATTLLGYSHSLRSQPLPELDFISVETSTSTTTVIVESTILVQPVETKHVLHTSTGVALIPLHETHGEEGLFGYSMPSVSFKSEGDTGVLIHVDPSIPKTWTAQRECVKIHATRGDKTIPLEVNFTSSDAIHVEFAKAEAYGIVQIKLSSKCRPKFEKSVKVHFGKGVIEQVFDCVGELAHILTGLQVADSPRVERCKALKSMSDNVDRTLTSAKDKGFGLVTSQLDAATRMLSPIGNNMVKASEEASRRFHQAEEALKAVADRTDKPLHELRYHGAQIAQSSLFKTVNVLGSLRDNVASHTQSLLQRATVSQRAHQARLKQAVSGINTQQLQHQLRFGVLDAQVAAKTWWLRATGRGDQSREYGRRAKEFIAELHAFSAQDTSRALKGSAKTWKSRCASKGAGQGRVTHQCVPVA